MKKVVVIGGGVAAKGFLGSALNLHKNTEYTLIRSNARGPVPCGIPYAFGTLDDPNKNQSGDDALINKGVKMIIDDVIAIDSENKIVHTKSNQQFQYDKLVLATGSLPVFPPFPGKELEGIYTIEKDLDKVVAMRNIVEKASSIAIVGGGFIGVELADEINKLGNKAITLIELAPHCLNVAFEPKYSIEIEDSLKKHGIKVLTGVGVKEFKGSGKVDQVLLGDGHILDVDLVFMAIGAYPNVSLATSAELELDEKKSIKVNKYQQTSNEHIYAIGDCASKIDIFNGQASNVRLASVAAKEGRTAALNLFDAHAKTADSGIMNLFSTAIDGKHFAATGMTKQQCEAAGYDLIEISVSAGNKHPETLPNTVVADGIFFFDKKDLTLIGAQISGDKEVAEMINTLGVVIQNKGTAYDLYNYNYGTHPMGTASPNKYIMHQAAMKAVATTK
ncbi:MAG: FAD-dependent oxidoreductase [Clostridia bacterium]|nr:FAD-dependent oxidoreductase [Clostridia bacterium]